jgi:hypothetical protein
VRASNTTARKPPDPTVVAAPKKPFSDETTTSDLPKDIVEYLRALIPATILNRIPKWWSFTLREAHTRAADEIEALRLAAAERPVEDGDHNARMLAVITREIDKLENQIVAESHLPEDKLTITREILGAFDRVRHFYLKKVAESK